MPSFRSAFVFTAIALAAFSSAAPTGTAPVKDAVNNTHNVAGVVAQANGNKVHNDVEALHRRVLPPPPAPKPAPAPAPPKPFPRRDAPAKDVVNNTKNVAGVAGQANDNKVGNNVHVARSACTTCNTAHGVIDWANKDIDALIKAHKSIIKADINAVVATKAVAEVNAIVVDVIAKVDALVNAQVDATVTVKAVIDIVVKLVAHVNAIINACINANVKVDVSAIIALVAQLLVKISAHVTATVKADIVAQVVAAIKATVDLKVDVNAIVKAVADIKA